MIPTHFGLPPYSEYPAVYERMKKLAVENVALEEKLNDIDVCLANYDAFGEHADEILEDIREILNRKEVDERTD